jgi:hypothetical protein
MIGQKQACGPSSEPFGVGVMGPDPRQEGTAGESEPGSVFLSIRNNAKHRPHVSTPASKLIGAVALVQASRVRGGLLRIPPSCAREETPESRGMPCLFLNTERGFGGKAPKRSGFRRHLAGSKMPKEGSKMPKEAFFTAISRWRVVSLRALDASGFWQG